MSTTDSAKRKYHKTSVNIPEEIYGKCVELSKTHHIPVNTTIILLLDKSLKSNTNGNVL